MILLPSPIADHAFIGSWVRGHGNTPRRRRKYTPDSTHGKGTFAVCHAMTLTPSAYAIYDIMNRHAGNVRYIRL